MPQQNEDQKIRILIVDDVPRNIQIAANILQQQDYQMAFAQNGKAALAQAQNHRFDLILLDIMMPEMDGFEVCKQLKESPITKDVPVMFLTAKTDSESIVKGFELGAIDYISKPFNSSELLVRVKTHIELHRTQLKLKEANATKDKFFSIIAHDMKNPFSALLGFSRMLKYQCDSLSKEKLKELISIIHDSAESTYKLLENLLNWSRMQIGTMECKPKEIDLYLYAMENVSLLKTMADKKEISITVDIPPKTYVFGDSNMLNTVIRNLLSNAIKFTPLRGMINISSRSIEDDCEEITVADNGVGILKEDQAKLFRIDVYYSTLGTNMEKGTGLGLILCREFIEKNNGKIWIESEPKNGSKFKFTLPKKANS